MLKNKETKDNLVYCWLLYQGSKLRRYWSNAYCN